MSVLHKFYDGGGMHPTKDRGGMERKMTESDGGGGGGENLTGG